MNVADTDKTMDNTGFYSFIMETLKNRKASHKWIRIGTIVDYAQERIKQKCGANITEIHIDNSGIIHAITQAHHNLEPEDLLYAVDVINTTNDIDLSEKKHIVNQCYRRLSDYLN